MDFKFWGAAPGGFFENPTIFGVFGLVFPSSGVRLVRWPLPLGRWPHSGDTVSCVFFPQIKHYSPSGGIYRFSTDLLMDFEWIFDGF